MYIKAEDNNNWTIADELKYHGDWIDGIYFDTIEICYSYDLRKSDFYTIEQGYLNLGKILFEAFGEAEIAVIDTGKRRVFCLAR